MTRKSTYTVTIILFIAALFFIFFRFKNEESKKENTFYPLKERNSALAAAPGWSVKQQKASNLYKTLNDSPNDKKALLSLAALFIQEARTTGDYIYYDKAAMHQVNKVLSIDPNETEALTYKALIYLSQHHFADGLQTAKEIEKKYPDYAYNYGILVDANVEMGNYDEAIKSADKMTSIRPDLSSYSRISYLREINGDYPGAIAAMQSAVKAGQPGDEGTEWARVQLGHLYENTGDLKNAEMHYLIALDELPGYAFANAGLARIAAANKDYKKAIDFLQKGEASIADYSFKEQLALLYLKTGEKAKSDQLLNEVINGMSQDSKKGKDDESIGHYADRELANAYVIKGDYEKAIEHALAEYNRRPNNIDVNQTVAWVYYKKGEVLKAIPYIETALKTNGKNPTLLCEAGLIYAKNKNVEKAKSLLQQGLNNNPNIDEDLKMESTKMLQTL
ncbi:MAG: tetratricopeptide repeat protein [Chitinophagaceae bacterium]